MSDQGEGIKHRAYCNAGKKLNPEVCFCQTSTTTTPSGAFTDEDLKRLESYICRPEFRNELFPTRQWELEALLRRLEESEAAISLHCTCKDCKAREWWASSQIEMLEAELSRLKEDNAYLKDTLEAREKEMRANDLAWVRNHSLIAKNDALKKRNEKLEAVYEAALNLQGTPEIHEEAIQRLHEALVALDGNGEGR